MPRNTFTLNDDEITTVMQALMFRQQTMAEHANNAQRLCLSENHHHFMSEVALCETAYRKILNGLKS